MNIKSFAALLRTALLFAASGAAQYRAAVHFDDAGARTVAGSQSMRLGATGTLTSLLCVHEGAGADPGLAPDPSDFRF